MITNKIIKSLSYGVITMGVIHIIATFSPLIAGQLEPLSESARWAFTYMSLMCGALLILGGSVVIMLADRVKEHMFLRCPYLFTVWMLAIDGVLAAVMMPHNPCAWVIMALTVALLSGIGKNKK